MHWQVQEADGALRVAEGSVASVLHRRGQEIGLLGAVDETIRHRGELEPLRLHRVIHDNPHKVGNLIHEKVEPDGIAGAS
eukprot:6440928-Pyramimonas_sp.AAC.2